MKLQYKALTVAIAAPAALTLLASCGGGGEGAPDKGDGSGSGAEAGASGSTEGLVEMTTDFPQPMFVGTPVPVKLENLEATGNPKMTFMAPEGSTNVAKGKTVTSSDVAPIFGDVTLVTDGDKAGSDGSYVELAPGKQWVQVDLGKEETIHAINVWHYHKAAAAYLDVIVQISNDPEFKEATTVYNNDHDNSSEMGAGDDKAYIETNHGRLIEVKGVKGQHVRLWSKGNTANEVNHYVEVEVFAAPGA